MLTQVQALRCVTSRLLQCTELDNVCFSLREKILIVYTDISSSNLRLLNVFDFILVRFYVTVKILVPNDINKIFIFMILQCNMSILSQ